MRNAELELARQDDYDHVVVNDDLSTAVDAIRRRAIADLLDSLSPSGRVEGAMRCSTARLTDRFLQKPTWPDLSGPTVHESGVSRTAAAP